MGPVYRYHFQINFCNESCYILLEIPLKYIPKSAIDHKLALVQIMDWHITGDKQLSEPMMA